MAQINTNISAREGYAWILWLCQQIVVVGLLLVFTAIVLNLFGFRLPYVNTIPATELCYLAGAWYLYRH